MTLKGNAASATSTRESRLPRSHLVMHNIFGVCDERFSKVEKVFKKNFLEGWEKEGAAVAVYYKGELVVDLQGGYRDASSLTKWTDDTRTVIFSVTKAVASLCIGMLVSRGRIGYQQKVADFWPEFAQNGKQAITVEWVMCHKAGLCVFDEPVTLEVAADPEKMAGILEKMKPVWQPGTRSGYHAVSFGWLVDQIVRKADEKGRGMALFFKEEIADIHGIDFSLGLPENEQRNIARLTLPTNGFIAKELLRDPRIVVALIVLQLRGPASMRKQVQNIEFIKSLNTFNSPDVLKLEQPAALGITKARDLAKTFSLMLDGTLLPKEFVKRFETPQINEVDYALKVPSMKGHGFMYEKHPLKQGKFLYGHPGFGGSVVIIDPEDEVVIAYLCNGLKLGNGELAYTYRRLRNATLKAVQRIEASTK